MRTFHSLAGTVALALIAWSAPAEAAPATSLQAKMSVGGPAISGGTIVYTIVVTNTGSVGQADNPGHELSDVLPPELALKSAVATSGTTVALVASNTVTWDGALTAGASVTLSVQAVLGAVASGQVVSNQATLSFDGDGNGSNESTGASDDPATAAAADATRLTIVEADIDARAAVPAECPGGGAAIVRGVDIDGDGRVVGEEAVSAEPICNGDAFLLAPAPLDDGICEAGGVLLVYGYDQDGDGEIGDGEDAGSFPVCNGVNDIVVETVDPGETCALGGSAIVVGGSVQATLCAPGTALVEVAPVAASGEACAGTLVTAGVDADADGALAPGEVTSSTRLCDALDGTPIDVSVTEVAPDVEGCPAGGVSIAFGELGSALVCNGADGADAPAVLVELADAALGDCPTGGAELTSGVDADGDGALAAPSEIAVRTTLCNGLPGAAGGSVLIALTPATADACAIVKTGRDDDGDGVLDDPAEVDTTTQLCPGSTGDDGPPGDDGPDGHAVLAATTDASAAACADGGIVLTLGRDDDGDGTLDPDEVETTQTLCNGADAPDGSCSVVDDGDGTGHVTCPDGTDIELKTPVAKDNSGCASGGVGGALGLLGALLVLARRRLGQPRRLARALAPAALALTALAGSGGSASAYATYHVDGLVDAALDGHCSLNELARTLTSEIATLECVNVGPDATFTGIEVYLDVPGNHVLHRDLDGQDAVIIHGLGAAQTTITGGVGTVEPIAVFGLNNGGTLQLSGVTLIGGNSPFCAGVVSAFFDIPLRVLIEDSVIADCSGPAIYMVDASPDALATVNRSQFRNNGGALELGCDTVLNDVVFESNTAANGGAVHTTGDLTVRRGVVDANHATASGGAISADGTVDIEDATFTGNSATSAGGAVLAVGEATHHFARVSFFQNTAATGGAVRTLGADFVNASFVENTSTGAGSAIFDDAPSIAFSTFFANVGNLAVGTVVPAAVDTSLFQQNRTALGVRSDLLTFTGGDNLFESDVVVPLTTVTSTGAVPHVYAAPTGGGTAVRDLVACGETIDDLLGDDRPSGVLCDVGAIELAAVPRTLVDVDAATTAECPAGGQALVVGLDADDDGHITGLEIAERYPICNGLAFLVNRTGPTATEGCPDGGVILAFGYDEDGDGTLDAGEVQVVTDVCQAAFPTVTLTPIANGATCPAGGTLVSIDGASATVCRAALAIVDVGPVVDGCRVVAVGVDWDGNGALDEGEGTSSTTVCDGADATPTLVLVDAAPTGACPDGGQQAVIGRDANGDLALTGAEIETTATICDGTPGGSPVALVTITASPEGACPRGGRLIAAGIDDDDDGVLSVAERDSSHVVCDGARGPSGRQSLVSIEAATTAACPNGGTVIRAGIDLDNDGSLDLEGQEVQASTTLCDGADGADGPDGDPGADATALLVTTAAASSDQCGGNGGWVVTAGQDADADGVIDAVEVSLSDVICNGADANAEPCVVTDNGDGTAHVVCPDGSALDYRTATLAGGGCDAGGGAGTGIALVLAALALAFLRARHAKPVAVALATLGGGSAWGLDYHVTTLVDADDGQCSLTEAADHAMGTAGNDDCGIAAPSPTVAIFLDVAGTHTLGRELAVTTLSITGMGSDQTSIVFGAGVGPIEVGDAVLADATLTDVRVADGPDGCILFPSQSAPAPTFSATRVVLEGCDGSGAVRIRPLAQTGTITLIDTLVRDNHPDSGEGAIALTAGNVNLLGVTFSGNISDGDGAAITTSGTVAGARAVFSANLAVADGGALRATNVDLQDAVFSANAAELGGAIAADDVALDRTSFSSNAASVGGAIDTSSGTITNSTFAANTATLDGTAISSNVAALATIHFQWDTFVDNHGGGATVSAFRVDLWDNLFQGSRNGAGAIVELGTALLTSGGGNIFEGARAVTGSDRAGLVVPLRVVVQGRGLGQIYAVPSGEDSALRDQVVCTSAFETDSDDQLGKARPVGVLCDIGAVELPIERRSATRAATSAECPSGGQVISVGRDYDGNGVVDGEEAVPLTPICNGTRFIVAPRDATPLECADGGTTLAWGYDADDDGVLDPDETVGASPVCNGPTSFEVVELEPDETCPLGSYALTTPEDSVTLCKPGQALVLVDHGESELCPQGGVVAVTGYDLDGDGVLEEGEWVTFYAVCDLPDGADGAVEVFGSESCPNGGTELRLGIDRDGDGLPDDDALVTGATLCDGLDAPNGAPSLVTSDEAAAADCPDGGVTLTAGADDDGDETLDADEVDLKVPMCDAPDGPPGVDALVAVTAASAAACPDGGIHVTVGLDDDRDGALVGDEIGTATDVCSGKVGDDGAPGVDGPAGHDTIVATEDATAASCPAGGLHLTAGRDDDGDGTLDAGEVETETNLCAGEPGDDSGVCTITDGNTLTCPGADPVRFVTAAELEDVGCGAGSSGGGGLLAAALVSLAWLARRRHVAA
ncbi:MAG: MYXO-CTERM sorting domain-containing protein [Myxococcota bacterium]